MLRFDHVELSGGLRSNVHRPLKELEIFRPCDTASLLLISECDESACCV
jgi:hypothetical protein